MKMISRSGTKTTKFTKIPKINLVFVVFVAFVLKREPVSRSVVLELSHSVAADHEVTRDAQDQHAIHREHRRG